MIRSLVFIVALLPLAAGAQSDFVLPYNLSKPSHQIVLPSVLHEVSGITELDSTSFACIQDENGILFIYDLASNKIKKEVAFAYNGDYEGVTRVGKSIYVLRSDGAIFEVPDLSASSSDTKYYPNNVPARNNEGLCYDRNEHRILIGCKGKVEDESRLARMIYGFDVDKKVMLSEPVFRFSTEVVSRFAIDRGLIEPYKITGKGKTLPNRVKFHTSEIAIHPDTGHLYVLSAADYMLFVFDRQGRLHHIEKLDPVMFNKAEGITFLANGDMVITNEGQQQQPRLLRFSMIKRPSTN